MDANQGGGGGCWLAQTSPHTHGPEQIFSVGACMCLICLLAIFRHGLPTPITFLRPDPCLILNDQGLYML